MPHHTHDCKACISLGDFSFMGTDYDLYICNKQADGVTLVARYGIDGDYASMSPKHITEDYHPCLREAKHRAIKEGLVQKDS